MYKHGHLSVSPPPPPPLPPSSLRHQTVWTPSPSALQTLQSLTPPQSLTPAPLTLSNASIPNPRVDINEASRSPVVWVPVIAFHPALVGFVYVLEYQRTPNGYRIHQNFELNLRWKYPWLCSNRLLLPKTVLLTPMS